MSLFLSTYINKVDKKGRVSVPASFRSTVLGKNFQGLILLPSPKFEALEGFTMEQMERLSSGIETFDMFSEAHDDLAASIFGAATPVEWGDDGRISLSEDLMRHAGITENVAFVGLGRKFQVWEPTRLEKYKADARDRMKTEGRTIPNITAPLNEGN